jgi:uncharacterized protein with HEPN domain
MRLETLKRFEDARAASERVARFIDGRDKAAFIASDLLRAAVERQLEIIGEALGRAADADPEAEQREPELRRIVGMRNRLIHGYGEVDHHIVRDVATVKVPALRRALDRALASEEDPS